MSNENREPLFCKAIPVPGTTKPISQIEKSWKSGDCEVEIIPQGTLVEKIRCAGAGIPAFYTSTGLGTIVSKNKEHRSSSYHCQHVFD